MMQILLHGSGCLLSLLCVSARHEHHQNNSLRSTYSPQRYVRSWTIKTHFVTKLMIGGIGEGTHTDTMRDVGEVPRIVSAVQVQTSATHKPAAAMMLQIHCKRTISTCFRIPNIGPSREWWGICGPWNMWISQRSLARWQYYLAEGEGAKKRSNRCY